RNLSCTVENLNPITEYHYLLTSYNNDNKALTVSAGNFVTTDDVGIDNPLLVNGIWIYPNPASESFRIGGITGETQVTITDVSGKTLIKRTVAPNEAVSIQHLPKGVYTVRAGETAIRLIRK
ncbi:MAG: T9SS type A sorting domain-containing protein, partial [Dysgonamonadaceae bacterium]|nr:T9SS type A sorting domain-containing protein [Dysgonamonadaceae bacterium]